MCSSDAISAGRSQKTFYARFWVKITGRTRRDRFLSDGRVSRYHSSTLPLFL